MADRIGINEHYCYLRLKMPRALYDALILQHGGAETHALREIRQRWQTALLDLAADAKSPAPSTSAQDLRQSPQ